MTKKKKKTDNVQQTLFLSPFAKWALGVGVKAYGGHSISGFIEMILLRFIRTDGEVQAYMKRYGIAEPAPPRVPEPDIAT